MKYKYLLFDLDGTLFDYDKAEIKALQKTFRQFGFDFFPQYLNTYRSINKHIWQDFEKGCITQARLKMERFRRLAERLHLNFDAGDFSRHYLKNLSEETDLIDHALQMLNQLPPEIQLYLITNGLKAVQRPRIAASPIQVYFKNIIISEEVGSAKPAAEIFDVAFRIMEEPPKEEVMIVGDSLTSDIAGGVNYGINTCWFNPKGVDNANGFKPTYEIEHLSQLIPLITSS